MSNYIKLLHQYCSTADGAIMIWTAVKGGGKICGRTQCVLKAKRDCLMRCKECHKTTEIKAADVVAEQCPFCGGYEIRWLDPAGRQLSTKPTEWEIQPYNPRCYSPGEYSAADFSIDLDKLFLALPHPSYSVMDKLYLQMMSVRDAATALHLSKSKVHRISSAVMAFYNTGDIRYLKMLKTMSAHPEIMLPLSQQSEY